MAEVIRELDSGLFIVEEVKTEKPQNWGHKCAYCNTRSVDTDICPIGWRTSDNWEVDYPTCGHGKYITCPKCEKLELYGCPICGCGEMYT